MEASPQQLKPKANIPLGLQVVRVLLGLAGVASIIRPLAAPVDGDNIVGYAVRAGVSVVGGILALLAARELGKGRMLGLQLTVAVAILVLAQAFTVRALPLVPLAIWGGLLTLVWLNRAYLSSRPEP